MEDKKDVVKKKTNQKRKTTNRVKATKKVVKKEEPVKKVETSVEKEIEAPKRQSKATSFNLIEVIIIMVITAAFGIVIGSCATYFKDNVIDKNSVPEGFEEFVEVYNDIADEYYSSIDKEGLLEAGIKGMVDFLGDPHSAYLNYDDTYNFNQELEGEFIGLGVTVTMDENSNIYIVEVLKDSPAEKAGFKKGDILKKIGDTDVEGMDTIQTSYLIQGEDGTKVDITVERDGKEQVITFTRGKVEISSVTYNLTEQKNVGYIKMSIFAKNTPKQFKTAMDSLIEQGATSIIIDVRDNSGGYLSSAKEIATLFLNKGDVVYQLNEKGIVSKIKNENKKVYDVNLVVLMNTSSASASELLAASLNENLGTPLVGVRTFGKGTVQKQKQLSSGAMIKYTIQEWYTPNGNRVHEVGISPTNEVVLNEDYYTNATLENDNQYQAALEIAKK